jgi:hypothetical protein
MFSSALSTPDCALRELPARQKTLAPRINISAKVAPAWGSVSKAMPDGFGDFPGGGSSHLRASRAV